jgi:hypothetical protein
LYNFVCLSLPDAAVWQEADDLQEQAEPNLGPGKKLRSDDPNFKSAEMQRREKQVRGLVQS